MSDERTDTPEGAAQEESQPRRSSLLRRFVALVVVLAAAAGVAYGGVWMLMPVSRQEKVVIVEIPRKFGAREIAARLEDLKLIRSQYAFLAAGRVLGDLQHLKAGEYELSPHMTPVEILDKLARGDVKAYWATIPEGYTIREITAAFHKMGVADGTRFNALAMRSGMKYGVPRRSLEGYLFPSTYKIARNISEEQLVRLMVRTFDREVRTGMAKEIAERTNGLSLDETIVLASLVEREARVPEERARIAGVLVNRLRRDMRLECDATVQYALGGNKKRLLYKDLEVESPYNTYKHKGLPPGPICNPGAESIRAALRPEVHDYLFYVADGETGAHLFSRTFDEHRAAIRRVRGN